MVVSTTPVIAGEKVEKTLGLVSGSTIRVRWFGRDLAAGLKQLVGGEIKSYTNMLAKAREEALFRMMREAEALGADAIVNVRFATSQIMYGASEILAYGTAVKLAKDKSEMTLKPHRNQAI
jgi:uncharacterized protein YbjQ (UPF0145 family)